MQSLSIRSILDLFLWFQTMSLLTEAFQEGLFDQIVMAINAIFILLFLIFLSNRFGRAGVGITVLCAILVLQLLVPASLSLVFGGSGALFAELVKLTAWVVVLLFAIAVHTDKAKIQATMRTMHRCAFLLLAAVFLFQILAFGETAYGMGLFHLGGIKNEPSAAMFSLALLSSFIMAMPKRWQYAGILGLLLVTLLLMKRSSLAAGLLLVLIGLRYILPAGRMFRVMLFILSAFLAVVTVSQVDIGQVISGSDIISNRFKDLEKLQETSDLGYLGSGRLGLLMDHFQAFQTRTTLEQFFGLMIHTGIGEIDHGYLGQGLHAAAHNDLMEILTRGGFFGLVTYVALLVLIGLKLTVWAGRPSDPILQSILFAGKMAGFAYLLHIFIGVVFKVQFMVIIAVLVGIALRIGMESRRARPVVAHA